MSRVKPHQESPFQEVVCDVCGTRLGYVATYEQKRRTMPLPGIIGYPWSMAGITELRARPAEAIEADKKKLHCSCHSTFTIPDGS